MHIVGTDGQHVATLECVVIEQTEGVLHIAVVTDVQMPNLLIIRLIILVEGITQLQGIIRSDIPIHLQATREITITLR